MCCSEQFSDVTKQYLCCFYEILDNMIEEMTSAKLTNSISHNFIVQMIPHHQAAIKMSQNILQYTTLLPLQNIAKNIISEQTKGIEAMKEILEQQGFSENKTGSPRQVLKTAYQAGMINNEEVWLQALQARNNVAHAYNEAIAQNIVRESQEIYISMFRDLKTTLETNWL